MEKQTLKKQFHDNFIAIVSLAVAIITLCYITWREEVSERNHNVRIAGFEILLHLGELQIVTNHAFYDHDRIHGNPYLGWGHIALISDLSELLPPPVPETIAKLVTVWGEDWQKIKTDEEAVSAISDEIDASRKSVLGTIRYLR